jgi:energy-coupling factor transporter ATP-binding protein EcfA2
MLDQGPFRIEGLALRPSTLYDAPLMPSYLHLNKGLNVLYGLNGAGKSMVLQVLHALLAGRANDRFRLLSPSLIVGLNDLAWYNRYDNPDLLERYRQLDIDVPTLREQDRQLNIDAVALYAEFASEGWDDDYEVVDGSRYIQERHGDSLDQRAYDFAHRCLTDFVSLPAGMDRGSTVDELIGKPLFGFRPDYFLRRSAELRFMVDLLFRPSVTGPNLSALASTKLQSPEHDSPVLSSWREERTNHPVPAWVAPAEDFWHMDGGVSWQAGALGLSVYGMQPAHADGATAVLLATIHRALPSRKSPEVGLEELLDRDRPVIDEQRLMDSLAFVTRKLALWRTSSGRRLLQRAEIVGEDPWLVFLADGRLDASCGLAKVLSDVNTVANQIYARLLLDAPALEVHVPHPEAMVTGSRVRWGARRGPQSPFVPIDELSTAERSWAAIAIELALDGPQPGFLLIDEPEAALHRSAESFMAEGLMSIADQWGLDVVVATHSPELLNQSGANVNLIRRSDQGLVGGRQIHQLGSAGREDLLDMGLQPSDLLRRQRGFLLVEGEHDLIVLDAFIGDRLRELRIEMLPMRGAGKLKSALDARVLYDFTDAHVFVLLDALDSDYVEQTWRSATRIAKTQGTEAAIAHVRQQMEQIKIDEAKSLAAFMARAIERGLQDRHTPLAMSAPDILDYLPASAFVADAPSWKSLREELERDQGRPPSGTEFKKWLAKRGTKFSEANIRQAAKSIAVPDELIKHLNRMSETINRP